MLAAVRQAGQDFPKILECMLARQSTAPAFSESFLAHDPPDARKKPERDRSHELRIAL
jgi:hypothetical protein